MVLQVVVLTDDGDEDTHLTTTTAAKLSPFIANEKCGVWLESLNLVWGSTDKAAKANKSRRFMNVLIAPYNLIPHHLQYVL